MPPDPENTRYLILVRHGTREVCWDRPERDHAMLGWDSAPPPPRSQFGEEGRFATFALAGRIADQLEVDGIEVDAIVHGTHRVARQTAQIYQQVLRDRRRYDGENVPDTTLDPDCEDRPATRLERVNERVRAWRDDGRPGRLAYVLIGHQPDLSTLADHFAALPTGVLPVGAAESACVRLARQPHGGRLLWLLTNRGSDLFADLRQKIAAKYDVAKFFLGALVLNGGLLLNANLWKLKGDAALALVALGYLFLLLSLGFAVATLFAYDQLLMPTAFWGAGGKGDPRRWSVARPPSQAQIVLYFEMIHVWVRLFQPAALSAIAALLLFLCALAQDRLVSSLGSALNAYTLIGLGGLGALAVAALVYRANQPSLGTQD